MASSPRAQASQPLPGFAELIGQRPRSPLPFRYDRGLHLPAADLWLDPHTRRRFAFVSHGHTDHCRAHTQVVATPATALFYQMRTRRERVTVLPFGESLELDRHTVELFPSGHMLGGAQALIRASDGTRLVYTGDFKLHPNPAAESAEVRRCDVLVMECTFGQPRYRFPSLQEVRARLYEFLDRCFQGGVTPVVCGYALGKGQEALALLTSGGYRVAVHDRIYEHAQVYESLHVDLGSYVRLTPELVAAGEARDCVLLVPPHLRSHPPIDQVWPRRTVCLTGWALDRGARYRYDVDELLPLSDHADFDELLEYIERAQPQVVYTVHGEAGFAAELRRRGHQAEHLPDHCLLDVGG